VIAVAAAALLGAATWTFLEYVIHRWMGHDRRFRKSAFGVEHIRHHAEGDYFAPTWKKLVFASIVTAVLCLPAIALAGAPTGIAYIAGLMTYYGVYELLHRRNHTHAASGPYGRWRRSHHFHHHFVDGRTNHGVTTPLWDHVFGTYQPTGVTEVPRRLVMRWLVDPSTGDVRTEHAHRFSLGKAVAARAAR
jgi:sterol desaturase/sphingolipid hydroxylase (fatty acid hydroxylase superfamily)